MSVSGQAARFSRLEIRSQHGTCRSTEAIIDAFRSSYCDEYCHDDRTHITDPLMHRCLQSGGVTGAFWSNGRRFHQDHWRSSNTPGWQVIDTTHLRYLFAIPSGTRAGRRGLGEGGASICPILKNKPSFFACKKLARHDPFQPPAQRNIKGSPGDFALKAYL